MPARCPTTSDPGLIIAVLSWRLRADRLSPLPRGGAFDTPPGAAKVLAADLREHGAESSRRSNVIGRPAGAAPANQRQLALDERIGVRLPSVSDGRLL